MRNIYVVILAIVVVIVVALSLFYAGVLMPVIVREENVTQEKYSNCNKYLSNGSDYITQSFKVPFSILTSASFIATGSGDREVVLHIRADNISGEDITNITKKINKIARNKWVKWDFPDVEVNNYTTYYAVFECPDCIHMAVGLGIGCPEPETNIICFWYQGSNVYTDGNYWLNEEPYLDLDMAFEFRGY